MEWSWLEVETSLQGENQVGNAGCREDITQQALLRNQKASAIRDLSVGEMLLT